MSLRPLFYFFAAVSVAALGWTFLLGWNYHGVRAEVARLEAAGDFASASALADTLAVGPHVVWGWVSCLLVALAHSVALTYHLGTGWAIKYKVDEGALEESWYLDSKRIMGRAVAPSCAGLALVLGAFLTGGYTMMGRSDPSIHLAAALAGAGGQAAVYVWHLAVVRERGRLMDSVLVRLTARPDSAES